ncbi:uncharacterized protein LOC143284478 isoform X2 [Babylonia areolata]|uniref:uncharacterized protein LOC143284478 isoform X1 n=1 Tax=Babylonia areolata TaxID=304850 RepID=UPI003FCFF183
MASSKNKSDGWREAKKTASEWRQMVVSLYPDMHTTTICVPPVIVNRVPYTWDTVAGQPVLVVQQVQQPSNTSTSPSASVPQKSTAGQPIVSSVLPPWVDRVASGFIDIAYSRFCNYIFPQKSDGHAADEAFSSQKGDVSQNTSLSDEVSSPDQVQKMTAHNHPQASNVLSTQSQNTQTTLPQSLSAAQNSSTTQGSSTSQNQAQSQNQSKSQPPYSMWTSHPSPYSPPTPVRPNNVRDDFTQQYLLTNLQAMGVARREVMFILSQLSFTNYLKDLSCPKSAFRWFPRPANLGKQFVDGDFDILIIHRHYGILIGEIKSVGMVSGQLNKTEAQLGADISNRIWRAVKQLDRSEQVVTGLMRDTAPAVIVRKTVILPYVSSAQLLSILSKDSVLTQALCKCLGAADETDATRLCVCSDQLSDRDTPWKVTQADLSHLSTWWQHRMACAEDNSLTDLLYLDIVARFAGPATSVTVQCSVPPRLQIRTQGDAVSFLGETFARLVLTPEQVGLLNRAPRRVYIKGPPGTGKTVTLVLMGVKWLLQGHDVYVISASYETRGVCELICHQMHTTAALYTSGGAPCSIGRVQLLAFDMTINEWEETKKIVGDLAKLCYIGGPHRFIMDETMFAKNSALIDYWKLNPALVYLELFLTNQYIWMAGVTNHAMPPSVEEAFFTTPLRCAPAIQREVQAGLDRWALTGASIRYLCNGIPAPSDGLQVIRLTHGMDHGTRSPVDCEKCGENIADLLHRQLRVGGAAYHRGSGSMTSSRTLTTTCPAPLQYKDVFIVTRSSDLRDDVTDDTGKVVTSASGVVRGLRKARVPLYVLDAAAQHNRTKCQSIVSGMGVARFDRVVVSFSTFLQGLERKVVVWLPGENHRLSEEYIIESSELLDRVHALSRCTTQLVIVELPKVVEPELD